MNNKTLIILIIGAFMILIGIPVVVGIVGYLVIRNSTPEMSEITFDENVSDVSFSDKGLVNLYEGDGFSLRYPDKYTESTAYPNQYKFVENEVGLWTDISRINSDTSVSFIPDYRIFSERTDLLLEKWILGYFDMDKYSSLDEVPEDPTFIIEKVRYGENDYIRIQEAGLDWQEFYFTKKGDLIVGISRGVRDGEYDYETGVYSPTVDTIGIISSLNFE